jgi:hypothetical protein
MKKNKYLIYLLVFIFSFISISLLSTHADTGTVYYTNHYMVKGISNHSASEYKHTTKAVLYNSMGFIVCSNTYLEYSGIPTRVCNTPSALSSVIQIKNNASWQAHYHVSSAHVFDR